MAQDRLLHYLINKWSNYHLYYHHSISIFFPDVSDGINQENALRIPSI